MKKNGFTLVELLAVMLVLSVIVVIAAPVILNVNNSASNKISEQEKKNIIEAAKFLAIDLDDYTSSVYNCTGTWLTSCTKDGGKWKTAIVTVESLVSNGYINSSNKTCTGNIKIEKVNNDYKITLEDNVICE